MHGELEPKLPEIKQRFEVELNGIDVRHCPKLFISMSDL
jgi:hypothetical protein